MKLKEKLHIFIERLSSFCSYIKAFFIKKDSLILEDKTETNTQTNTNDIDNDNETKEISNTNDIAVVNCKVRKVTVKKHVNKK